MGLAWSTGWGMGTEGVPRGRGTVAGSLPLPQPRLSTDPILLEAGAPEAPRIPLRKADFFDPTRRGPKVVPVARRLTDNEAWVYVAENHHTRGYSFGTESNYG